jgi:DNA polymerase III delta prime subunit
MSITPESEYSTEEECQILESHPTKRQKLKPKAPPFSDPSLAQSKNNLLWVDDTLVAEQRVLLEFMAKRKEQARLERDKRERHRLRRCAQDSEQSRNGESAGPLGMAESVSRPISSTAMNVPWAWPRFPNPSHILPWMERETADNKPSSTQTSDKSAGSELGKRRIASDRAVVMLDTATDSPLPSVRLLPPTSDPWYATPRHVDVVTEPSSSELIQALLSQSFVTAVPASSSMLWVDRYYSNSSMKIESQAAARDQLSIFIQRFMVDRHKAHVLQAQRQEQRTHQKRAGAGAKSSKASSRRRVLDLDDAWTDDEINESHADSSICLITGPVGCGKTQLVHSVAQELGCRTVLELHTGVPRGAAAVKRLVAETTQSHSTLEMMQKPPRLFSKSQPEPSNSHIRDLCDTDDDDDHSVQSRQEDQPCSVVTVILMDEIDNLYDGDGSIWTALGELSKSSKCPIVLTANTLPRAMYGSAIQFQYISLDRPSVAECAQHLSQVLAAEQIAMTGSKEAIQGEDDDTTAALSLLEQVAILGRCDLRRMIHEVQLFAVQPTTTLRSLTINDSSLNGKLERADSVRNYNLPTIESIQPRAISSDMFSLVTITGSNFWSLVGPGEIGSDWGSGVPCLVQIGRQVCPRACIVSDSMILAVAAPILVPAEVRDSPATGQTRSHSALYASVMIGSASRLGVHSTSCGLVACGEQSSSSPAVQQPTTIEYRFPSKSKSGRCGHLPDSNDESSSEEEFEFARPTPLFSAPNLRTIVERDTSFALVESTETASRVLQEGVDAWKSVHGSISIISPTKPPQCSVESLLEMQDISTKAGYASDAAMFEDIGLLGLPDLAGSCHGFGFDLTSHFPKHNNETSKP